VETDIRTSISNRVKEEIRRGGPSQIKNFTQSKMIEGDRFDKARAGLKCAREIQGLGGSGSKKTSTDPIKGNQRKEEKRTNAPQKKKKFCNCRDLLTSGKKGLAFGN